MRATSLLKKHHSCPSLSSSISFSLAVRIHSSIDWAVSIISNITSNAVVTRHRIQLPSSAAADRTAANPPSPPSTTPGVKPTFSLVDRFVFSIFLPPVWVLSPSFCLFRSESAFSFCCLKSLSSDTVPTPRCKRDITNERMIKQARRISRERRV